MHTAGWMDGEEELYLGAICCGIQFVRTIEFAFKIKLTRALAAAGCKSQEGAASSQDLAT